MKYCASCQASYPLDYTACPKDQTPLQLVTDLMPGIVLRGKYEIIEKLGAGGMGAVYKARHLAFGELRAIKFVGSHLLEDERALARFRAEAVVARRLQHPNAVKVEDLDTTDDGRSFIVMEYVLGHSLRELFSDSIDVSTKRVLSLARQACGALAAAHALGIVHRDIKPDNLMIVASADGNEVLKVADFGLAKVLEGFDSDSGSPLTQTGFILGTPPYMSPEQASGLDVDGRSDLYSLGIVLYELFTGRLPFRSDSPIGMLIHHRETPPEAPAGLGVPQPLAEFLMKALAKRREDRFQTAQQMDEALRLLALMPLPELVGQGIREGFDPKWAGSRNASRMTTIQATPAPPRSTVAGRAEGRASGGNRSVRPAPASSTPPRFVTRSVDEPVAESPSRFWMWIGAAVLLGGWFVASRPKPSPPPSPPPPVAATREAPPQVVTQSEPARAPERTDQTIRFDIERLIGESTPLRGSRIQVEVANGVVTLLGEAPSQTTADLAATLASSVPGVRQVFSTLHGGTTQTEPSAASSAAAPAPQRPQEPRAEDASREQVRRLLDRAREKMESRNPEAAEADLLAVLKLDPNNPVAKDALEHLRNRPRPPGRPAPARPAPHALKTPPG